jgi:hypothetical protein
MTMNAADVLRRIIEKPALRYFIPDELRDAAQEALKNEGEPSNQGVTCSDVPIRYLGDMQRLSLRPGDRLVVHLDDYLSTAELKIHQRFLEDILGAKCILLPKGTRLAGALNEVAAETAFDVAPNR